MTISEKVAYLKGLAEGLDLDTQKSKEGKLISVMIGILEEIGMSIEDLEVIYQNIRSTMGVEATEDQRSNAESIYSLIRYGYTGGSSFEGADVPFIGADGFCSPIGENWRSVVTSEFGNRIDPITGQRRGHTGMDLAVPTGTPIRAALPGTVTVSTYNRGGYGYYIMIDHGDGLSTLYGHCSQLLASVGRIVNAGGCGCPVRFHRALHWPPPPLRGARQRPADKPTGLSAIRAEERKTQ